MPSFLDLLGLRRRRAPRVAACWPVEVRVPGCDRLERFHATDVSTTGVRLEGGTPGGVRQLLSPDGRARLRLHLPGSAVALEVEARLCWGLGDPLRTGWQFAGLRRRDLRSLAAYVADRTGQPPD
ncbi:MAG: PilZ domain-containing protein [Candidatus Latescibacterota bacterium]